MSLDDMGFGLKSSVSVYLLELVRLLLQYKWGTIFRQEWFWRMEELTKRNGKGAWVREIEKTLKIFGASLEWLMERINLREEEIDTIRRNDEMDETVRKQTVQAKRAKSIDEVLEEVRVLIDTHFFNEFSVTKSSMFLKKVIANRSAIDIKLLKKAWRTLNCSPKTMKVIREVQENLFAWGRGRS